MSPRVAILAATAIYGSSFAITRSAHPAGFAQRFPPLIPVVGTPIGIPLLGERRVPLPSRRSSAGSR